MQNRVNSPERYTKFIEFREALYRRYRNFGSRCRVIESPEPVFRSVNHSIRRYRNLVYWSALHFQTCMEGYMQEEHQLCKVREAHLLCLKEQLDEPSCTDVDDVKKYLNNCKLAWPEIKCDAANLFNILTNDNLDREEKLTQFNDYYLKMLPPELVVIKDLLDELFFLYRVKLTDEATPRKRKNMLLDNLKFFDLDMYERKCFSITGRSQELVSRMIRAWNCPIYDDYSFRFFIHKMLRAPEPYFESPYMIPNFPHRCPGDIPRVNIQGDETIVEYVIENLSSPDEDGNSNREQLI